MAKERAPIAPRLPADARSLFVVDGGAQAPEHQGAEVPKRSGAEEPGFQSPRAPDRARVHRRKDGRELKRISGYVPPELAIELGVFCARAQRDMSEVIAEALSRFLGAPGRAG